MRSALYIAARAPRPRFAKTRLGSVIGHEAASALYAAFLKDLGARFSTAPFPVGWYVTPADAWESVAPLVRPIPWPRAGDGGADGQRAAQPATLCGPVLIQGPGDWALRQQALFDDAPARGEARTILIASDSPHLTLDIVVEAFEMLERHDLVLGPVDDGGYYLVGMREPWPLLRNVAMSTGTVLAEIVTQARQLGLSVALTPQTFDVDEAEDLAQLAVLAAERDDLLATRSVLSSLGWPVRAIAPMASGHGAALVSLAGPPDTPSRLAI